MGYRYRSVAPQSFQLTCLDLSLVARAIYAISLPGLRWMAHWTAPIAFGILKLVMKAAITDQVSVCELLELIRSTDELVQSVDIDSWRSSK